MKHKYTVRARGGVGSAGGMDGVVSSMGGRPRSSSAVVVAMRYDDVECELMFGGPKRFWPVVVHVFKWYFDVESDGITSGGGGNRARWFADGGVDEMCWLRGLRKMKAEREYSVKVVGGFGRLMR